MKIAKIGDIFDVIKGKSSYTKSYGVAHKGDYPVFSASNNTPLTFTDTFDFDGKHITWATNGFAGYIKIIEGRFSINGDRGVLVPKYNNIDIEYIKYVLEPILRGLAKGRKGDNAENEFTKVYPWMVEQVEIEIPTDENGEFDLQAQQEIASQYILIDEFKAKIKEYQERIQKLQVQVEDIGDAQEYKLFEIFDIIKGSSQYTNKYFDQHPGEYPVYSSQTTNDGCSGMIDSYDIDAECITWTTDGIHAGTVFLRNGKFSMTTHCGAMVIKDKFQGDVSIQYLYSRLSQNLKLYAIGEQNKRVTKDVLSKINISIPTLPDGSFDLNRQKEIAEIYKSIAFVKSQIAEKLQILQHIQISV